MPYRISKRNKEQKYVPEQDEQVYIYDPPA